MSKGILQTLVAASALFTTVFAATSEAADTDIATSSATPDTGLAEIVVTARRKAEDLQDVPVSEQVVTSVQIQSLAITTPAELSELTPGLNISLENPETPVIVLRGVRWTQASGTPAIPVYLNEISFDPVQVLQTLYDVGQVEVLRGPQGTVRGAPSISGAVTISSRQPDLENFGGYVMDLNGEQKHNDVQGAINLPIVTDKLAVRLAANFEDGEANQVFSVHNPDAPSLDTTSGRVSLRFEPIDTLSFNVMFQRLSEITHQYTQVAGPGSPGTPALGVPANYNGPPLSATDYAAVQEIPNPTYLKTNLLTLNAAWDILGQRLTYDFGSQRQDNNEGNTVVDINPANLLVGYDRLSAEDILTNNYYVNEVRLASTPAPGRFIDYDVGYYEQTANSDESFNTVGDFLPGAFGNPFAAAPLSPFVNPAAVNHYALLANSNIELQTKDYSVYGNLFFHLPFDTELSAGARWIHDAQPANIATTTTPAFAAAFPNPAAPFLGCGALGVKGASNSPFYPGVCDVAVPGETLPAQSYTKTYEHTIYDISLSHKFTPDILSYATVGTSWRAGLPAIANTGLPSNLLFPNPEKATSFEVGVKTTWLDRRLRVNADVFQINYDGQLTQFQDIPYFNSVAGSPSNTTEAFFYNVNARVRGAEADIEIEPVRNLTVNANLSYARIESVGGEVPCVGSAPLSAANPINFCSNASGRTINAAPPIQASLLPNFVIPFAHFNGYLRSVINFQGNDPNFGTSVEPTRAYTLVDLFGGFTAKDSGWDIGAYAKNVFDRRIVLTSNGIVTGFGVDQLFGPSGYNAVTTTPPREVGVMLRYSFGSR
jgi:iron complex outermembrane receptor protein